MSISIQKLIDDAQKWIDADPTKHNVYCMTLVGDCMWYDKKTQTKTMRPAAYNYTKRNDWKDAILDTIYKDVDAHKLCFQIGNVRIFSVSFFSDNYEIRNIRFYDWCRISIVPGNKDNPDIDLLYDKTLIEEGIRIFDVNELFSHVDEKISNVAHNRIRDITAYLPYLSAFEQLLDDINPDINHDIVIDI